MVSARMRFVFYLFVFTSLFLLSMGQKCKDYTLPDEKVFANCIDLPNLSSFLHWTYTNSTGELAVAYRHSGVESFANRWFAWAVNPNPNLVQAMIGAQSFVAIPRYGALMAYTSSISSYNTLLEEGKISYNYTGLGVVFENNEVIIFVTLTLPSETNSLVHLWQEGPFSDSAPDMHDMDEANLNSKQVFNLI